MPQSRRRREAFVIALVLIPCGLLVAVDWLGTQGPSEALRAGSGSERPQVQAALPTVAQQTDAAVVQQPPVARELRAPLEAVLPAVRDCQRDTGRPGAQVERLAVDFRVTVQGTFADVRVELGRHDPRLVACIEDAFAEVRFVPSGDEPTVAVHYTFESAP